MLRAQWTLVLNYMMFACLLNTTGVMVARLVAEYGISEIGAALIENSRDLTVSLVSFFVVSRVIRWGARRMMVIIQIALVVGCLIMAIGQSYAAAYVLFLIAGASFALMKGSAMILAHETSANATSFGRMVNILDGVFMVGAMIGPLIFAWVMSMGWPWEYTYFILTLLVLPIIYLNATFPSEGIDRTAKTESNRATMRRHLSRRALWPWLGMSVCYVMYEQSFGTWLPLFNERYLLLDPIRAAQMLSLYVLGIALSRFMMAAIADRVSWFAVLVGMLVVALLLHTLTVSGLTQRWLGGALPAAVVFATLGFFIGPIYPTLNALLLMRTPRADQASMQGLLVVFSASGGMLGSMMLGAMMRSMDANLAYVSSLVPLTLLLASLFVIRRKAALLPETV